MGGRETAAEATLSESETDAVAPGGDPGKIHRSQTGIPIIPALDGFRAYAILGIVLFHMLGSTTLVTTEASRHAIYGILPSLVEVLFVISGFVVFLPTVVRGGDLGSVGSFAIRRGARLLPAYWLSLVVVLAMIAFWPTGDPDLPSAGSFAIHSLMAQVPATLVDQDFLIGFGVDAPLWTLSLEIAFYLVLPLIATAYFRRPFVGLAIAAAVTVIWKVGIVNLDTVAAKLGVSADAASLERFRLAADNQLPAFALCFALGMTAAWIYVRVREGWRPELLVRRAGLVQVGSLAAIAVCAWFFGDYALGAEGATGEFPAHLARRDLLLTIAFPTALALFMLSTTLVSERRQMPFAWRSSRALGDISYGIYLIHFPMIFFVLALLPSMADSIGSFWTLAIVALPASVLYGWASARFLEQPIRRWAHRFGRQAQSVAASPGDAAEVERAPAG